MQHIITIALMLLVSVSAYGQRCGRVKPTPHRVGTYTAGELKGRVLGDLYAAYIGVRGPIPAKVRVDPARQLDSLWRAKRACKGSSAPVVELHRELLAEYREGHTNKTIDQFIGVAEAEVRFVRDEMDWTRFGALYNMGTGRVAVVRKLAEQISGRDLVAYGLTELMPTADGLLNVRVLEFMVRNFGPEFVYAIPARHDKYASFGFYQFTSYAVFDNGRRIEGASLASRALRGGKLPTSVINVRGRLQHRAAYLFAIHNIARMVRGLSGQQLARLDRLPAKNHDDLIQFVAAAHNGPAYAYAAAKRWIDNNMRLDYYMSVSNRVVRRYAWKTKANLAALRSQGSLDGTLYAR